MIQVPPSSYFRANFLTVRLNAANDMALESLNKCETFLYIFFSQFLTGLSKFWKWIKTYFLRNFYKLYRNEENNIPLKSYGKCETFSCWWFSLISSRFQVTSKMSRSFVLTLSWNRLFENAPREETELLGMSTWTSLCFSHAFLARSSPSTHRNTHRNWASDI